MTYNPDSKENDPILLFKVMQQYPLCPEDVGRQRDLVAMFHDYLNGNGRKKVTVKAAEPYRLDEVARKIWQKAHIFIATRDGHEYEFLKYHAQGQPLPIGHPLEKRVEDEDLAFDLPGCMD